MRTLIVKYLPSGAESNTQKLLDLFLDLAPAENREEVDLIRLPPPLFNVESMRAYLKRHYRKESLTVEEAALLTQNDELIAQLKSAEILVMAYPMHNFSMPAAVKAYFDAVMFKDVTFQKVPAGFAPTMSRLKALTLYTAGTEYPQGSFGVYPHWDGVSALARIEFEFMGFSEIEILGLSLRGDQNLREQKLSAARARLAQIIERWYGKIGFNGGVNEPRNRVN
jgi:FMN-dependent NADH-azoreductase